MKYLIITGLFVLTSILHAQTSVQFNTEDFIEGSVPSYFSIDRGVLMYSEVHNSLGVGTGSVYGVAQGVTQFNIDFPPSIDAVLLINIYIPSSAPSEGIKANIWNKDVNLAHFVADTTLTKEQWHTITFNVGAEIHGNSNHQPHHTYIFRIREPLNGSNFYIDGIRYNNTSL